MKIELKDLQHSAALSQETHAFVATIVIDGVAAFHASNAGHGGADLYDAVAGYSGPSVADIDAWLAANTPPFEGHGMVLDNCLEFVVCDLINDVLARETLARLLASHIIVLGADQGEPALIAYDVKPTPAVLDHYRARIEAGAIAGELVNAAEFHVVERALKLV